MHYLNLSGTIGWKPQVDANESISPIVCNDIYASIRVCVHFRIDDEFHNHMEHIKYESQFKDFYKAALKGLRG